MPWNPTTKMMTMPISLGDISQAVGYSGPDLVANGIINMWAKYKFVRNGALDYSAQMNAVPLQATEWLQNATWWKGSDGKCGINIAEYTDLGSPFTGGTFFYFLKNEALSWTYNRPRGPQYSEWQRVFDMFRYYGAAQAPVGALASVDVWFNNNYEGQIDYDTHTPNAYELSLTDFALNNTPLLGNYYLGVLLWKTNGTFYFLTSSNPVAANQAFSIPFTGAQSLVGTWNVVPFISSRAYSMGASALTGIYASCFGIRNNSITFHAPGTIIDFEVNSYWNAAHTFITYEVIITNNGATSQTVTGIALDMRDCSPSQQPQEGTAVSLSGGTIGSVTVAGNSSERRTGIATPQNFTYNPNRMYYIKGYADNFPNAPYNQIEELPD